MLVVALSLVVHDSTLKHKYTTCVSILAMIKEGIQFCAQRATLATPKSHTMFLEKNVNSLTLFCTVLQYYSTVYCRFESGFLILFLKLTRCLFREALKEALVEIQEH